MTEKSAAGFAANLLNQAFGSEAWSESSFNNASPFGDPAAFGEGSALKEGSALHWPPREAPSEEHKQGEGKPHAKFSSFMPLSPFAANKKHTPPFRYITVTL